MCVRRFLLWLIGVRVATTENRIEIRVPALLASDRFMDKLEARLRSERW